MKNNTLNNRLLTIYSKGARNNCFGTIWHSGLFKLFTLFASFLILFAACKKEEEKITPTPVFKMQKFVTGLSSPMGLESDNNGNLWVAIPGTAKNDGKVVVIDADGNKYDAIVNLASRIHPGNTELEGPASLLIDGNTLYILAANMLYEYDISGYTPGQAAIDANTLASEDITTFVLNYPFTNNYHDSHPYNMVIGPDGDIYITDAGANAIIHRTGVGTYKVLAEIPPIPNPTQIGPPMVQSVPTSIYYDGTDFLVTSLLGFPFPAGMAKVYKVSTSGHVSVYQDGFTCLVNLSPGLTDGEYFVLQYGTFGQMGFNKNTGGIYSIDGQNTTLMGDTLNMPVGIKQTDESTWYISSMGDGNIFKVTYKPE